MFFEKNSGLKGNREVPPVMLKWNTAEGKYEVKIGYE